MITLSTNHKISFLVNQSPHASKFQPADMKLALAAEAND